MVMIVIEGGSGEGCAWLKSLKGGEGVDGRKGFGAGIPSVNDK